MKRQAKTDLDPFGKGPNPVPVIIAMSGAASIFDDKKSAAFSMFFIIQDLLFIEIYHIHYLMKDEKSMNYKNDLTTSLNNTVLVSIQN